MHPTSYWRLGPAACSIMQYFSIAEVMTSTASSLISSSISECCRKSVNCHWTKLVHTCRWLQPRKNHHLDQRIIHCRSGIRVQHQSLSILADCTCTCNCFWLFGHNFSLAVTKATMFEIECRRFLIKKSDLFSPCKQLAFKLSSRRLEASRIGNE